MPLDELGGEAEGQPTSPQPQPEGLPGQFGQNMFTKLYQDLSDSEKEEILAEQKERLAASLDLMKNLYPDMLENFKRYRGIAKPLEDDDGKEITARSNLFVRCGG